MVSSELLSLEAIANSVNKIKVSLANFQNKREFYQKIQET